MGIWICACVTIDEAPTWLIYQDMDATLRWCSVPPATEPFGLVDPTRWACGHADPKTVLLWLSGSEPEPWGFGGSGWGDEAVLAELRGMILRG